MRRRFRLVGVLVTVGVTVGGALVTHAVDDVDGAAKAHVPAHRLAAPQSPERPASTAPTPATAPSAADGVVALENAERLERGMAPYAAHPQLTAAAQTHSIDMATRNLIGHTGSDGSDGGDRLTAQGFTWSTWGENLGAGQLDPQSIVTAWMQSSSHRPHVIGNFQYAGVGVAASANGTLYWTLVVAS